MKSQFPFHNPFQNPITRKKLRKLIWAVLIGSDTIYCWLLFIDRIIHGGPVLDGSVLFLILLDVFFVIAWFFHVLP